MIYHHRDNPISNEKRTYLKKTNFTKDQNSEPEINGMYNDNISWPNGILRIGIISIPIWKD